MNRQNKYMKANSQINSKQNWTGGFRPPCSEYVLYECSTLHYWTNGSVQVWKCSKGPPLTSNNNSHPFWIHFCCPMHLSSKNHNPSIFLAVFVLYDHTKTIFWSCSRTQMFCYIHNWWRLLLVLIRFKKSHQNTCLFMI